METRIFVSHSRQDGDFTQRLVDDLHRAGAEVWVDVAGFTHANFGRDIDRVLAECEWMVLVLTPNALTSQDVKDVVHAALLRVNQSSMQAVIPMLAAPCMLDTIPPQWEMLHRYDATEDYPAALAGVLHAVGLPPIPQSSVPAALPPPQAPAVLRSLESVLPPDRFPIRMAHFGFEGRVIDGVEVILPPVCAVPAGEFLMGSIPKRDQVAAKESWTDDEQPQHTVVLPAYEIARFPVTVAEYACFVRAGHPPPSMWPSQEDKLDHPVVAVTWHNAVAYVAWLAGLIGVAWRLPTEAEWEKAARGTNARIYPWGDTFDEKRCNTNESAMKTTTPIGAYPIGASPYGVQDMAGNVWEWTSSRYAPYPYTMPEGREDALPSENRVLRGGSWGYSSRNARAACRDLDLPGNFRKSLGFRMART